MVRNYLLAIVDIALNECHESSHRNNGSMTSSNESHVRLPAKEPVRGKDKHRHPNDHEDHQADGIVPALDMKRKKGTDGGLGPSG